MRIHAPRLALALLAAAASCAPAPDPSPPPPMAGVRRVACAGGERPQQPATATANAQGAATLVMAGPRGRHMLRVPEGAAKPGTVFTMRALPAPDVGVDIRADGQDSYTFQDGRRATLSLSGEHCTGAEWNRVRDHVVARIENTLRPVSGRGAAQGQRVTAELPSLSGYLVGGN